MNMEVRYSRRFEKELKRVSRKIQAAFSSRLLLFIENKFHPFLNNHSLSGKMADCHSINITGDWRAIYKELENGEIIFFVMLGTHSQLY